MSLVIVALVLFAALVACWLILPGEAATLSAPNFEAEPLTGAPSVQQVA